MSESANITAELKEIEYVTRLVGSLETFEVSALLNHELSAKGSFVVRLGGEEYALSQWVSPKRTRTFPLARVYDTLCRKNRVTLIPFCKDEGKDGDRDFLQWDTVSLMSLLNVYVIVCYYNQATKNQRAGQIHKNKISKQILDYDYVCKKLDELQNYHSSALHWNLKQMEQLSEVAKLTLNAYQKISRQTGVVLHGEDGIKKRIKIARKDASRFQDLSRELAEQAQRREISTNQPKEKTIEKKAVVTLTNLLGGIYYWTADECFVFDECVFLVEKKHSATKLLPSPSDLKDAFLKSALFSSLRNLKYNHQKMRYYSAVGLTSNTVRGCLHSNMSDGNIKQFLSANQVNEQTKKLLLAALREAQCNGFGLFIMNAKDAPRQQRKVLRTLLAGVRA